MSDHDHLDEQHAYIRIGPKGDEWAAEINFTHDDHAYAAYYHESLHVVLETAAFEIARLLDSDGLAVA